MRNLFSSAILLLVGLILAAAASAANPVFKWKDSSGHSHYSQSPPQDQKYQIIMPTGVTTDSSATAPPAAVAVAVAKTSDDASTAGLSPAVVMRKKNCDTARANISTLNAHASVTSDINGDGKAVTLNVAQHNAALAEAGKQVDLYCAQ